MSKKNRDGLKKIYLFKSADYQFAEINLSDNTLLLGESGVGKTTLMRAILFFYTMDNSSSALNINTESKKSFNQWYFQERNSHIVYEYHKEDNPFLFVVSNSGHLHYTFIEMNDNITVKDLFLKGNQPVTLEELNENIEKNILITYHTAQIEKYIRIFHKKDMDGKRIKQESKVDFTLFENMTARKEFAKTLSNIFATSKVSADSVKKTIVSLIQDNSSDINLKNIKDSLKEYVLFREEIRKFERQTPKINELQDAIDEYKVNSNSFENYANQIDLLKRQSDVKLFELNEEFLKEEVKNEKEKSLYEPKIKELKNTIQEVNKFIIIEDNFVKELKIKRDEYQAKNIETLVAEHHKQKSYEKSLKQTQKRYEALTANANEVKEKYEEIFKKLEDDKKETIFELKDEIRVKKEILTNETIDAYASESKEIEEQTSLLLNEEIELKDKFNVEKNILNEKKIEKIKVENFQYNQKDITKYEDELKQFSDKIQTLTLEIPKLTSHIKQLERTIESIPNSLKEQKERLKDKLLTQKNKLMAEKKNIEKKLDFDKENLYGYINKNELKERNKLLTFLKDEILFSERKLSIQQVANSSSIFGLDIEFEDNDFGFDYDVSSLQEELIRLKEKIKELDRKSIEEMALHEENARKETSKLNKERTRFFKEKVEIETEIEKYKTYSIKSKNSLIDAKNKADTMRSEALEKIIKSLVEQEEKVKFLTNKIENTSLKMDEIKKKIKANTKKIILRVDSDLSLLKVNEEEKIAIIEEKYLNDKKQSEEELKQHLEAKGVDKEQLAKLSSEIKIYEQKLKDIDKNFSYVSIYLSEYAEAIKNILTREENLEKKKVKKEELGVKLEELENEFTHKLKAIESAINKIEETRQKLNNFIIQYKNEIENQPIHKEIKAVLKLEYKVNISDILNNEESLSSVVSNIVNLYQKLINNRDVIINKTQLATNRFNSKNIFKLKIIDDYMKDSHNFDAHLIVANDWVEYVQKDKISILKESSSDKFINEFNAISKYIQLFESSLFDIEEKVNKLDKKIKKAVDSFNVIDAIKIKKETANNETFKKLKELTTFYSQNSEKLISGLFTAQNKEDSAKIQNELASKIESLSSSLSSSKEYLSLQEGFVLTFTVTENGNRLKPAQSLNDIGSNGTSTLVKSIINISLLEMVNKNSQILNHCILDEIGTISPKYFKELKDYANSSGFLFVNGMPTEDDILISMYPTVYIGQNYGKYSRMLLASKMVV